MKRLSRLYHRLYARLFGYFWLPCPICGGWFGGHERPYGHIMLGWGRGMMTCAGCIEEAEKRNRRFMEDNPYPAKVVSIEEA